MHLFKKWSKFAFAYTQVCKCITILSLKITSNTHKYDYELNQKNKLVRN